ncbi:nicotinamide N-methyltransferase-like isoform X1 [Petromyzon marinus]|uniref:nicotinamide N-methyltransferase-like isoform X1 n=2 Tax=Petromyzon marinus TaxID=7757 RepID=UPI003F7091EF
MALSSSSLRLSQRLCGAASTATSKMAEREVTRRQGKDYATHFSPREYMRAYFSTAQGDAGEGELLPQLLQFLHSAFATGEVSGQRLLDVGSGPTIYQVLSACESFPEIYLSEYAQSNREELQGWLNCSPDAFDWTSIVQFVCRLEGRSGCEEEKTERLRRAVQAVLPCDVNQDDLLLGSTQIPDLFDCVLSTLCLEAACDSVEGFGAALSRMCGRLRPGGWLVMTTVLQETFYRVGVETFRVLPVDEGNVVDAVRAAGFTVRRLTKHGAPDVAGRERASDFKGLLLIVAQKK